MRHKEDAPERSGRSRGGNQEDITQKDSADSMADLQDRLLFDSN